ncbi:MAG: glucose-6-phosphate isomerase [Chloroflexi bacterium]|nr:glucose-6-phosphate isomerase [Chloroflexota bacterium]
MGKEKGPLRFLSLPRETKLLGEIKALAEEKAARFENVLVVGIGGSTWPTIAIQNALCHPYHNLLSHQQRQGRPRFFFIDNCDPDETAAILDVLDLKRTLISVVSKSGSTPEPMANFAVLHGMTARAIGNRLAEHFVITTDEGEGPLRKVAAQEGIPCLSIPANVPGRFAGLSAVTLFPASMMGIDIEELLAGAQHVDALMTSWPFQSPLPYVGAGLLYLAKEQRGCNTFIFMPYSRRLRYVGDWYRQLWAESLGKKYSKDGSIVYEGSTPVNALGAADQHSVLQLMVDGPFDKFTSFVAIERYDNKVPIEGHFADVEQLDYFDGHSLAELISVEQRATEMSLSRQQRLYRTIVLPEINAFVLGELMQYLQVETYVVAELLNINAFDQPGVEEGKNITYALMGRKGYEKLASRDMFGDDSQKRFFL